MTSANNTPIEQEIKRELSHLTALGLAHSVAFPIAALAAGLSIVPGLAFLFPATAVIATIGVGLVQLLTNSKKAQLTDKIESAEKRRALAYDTAQELKSELNGISVSGPST